MKIKDANLITGKLSNPDKMPCKAYNIPADECKVGSKLAEVKGSACYDCYAKKGRYVFPNVKSAMYRRLDSISRQNWVQAMVVLISKQSPNFFRWHDSGDLQSLSHLKKIVEVCEKTPSVKHWLPTREYRMVMKYLTEFGNFPKNLIVRVSIHMVDDFRQPNIPNVQFSGIAKSEYESIPSDAHICPAEKQKVKLKNGKMSGPRCGDCRKCWGDSFVIYPYH